MKQIFRAIPVFFSKRERKISTIFFWLITIYNYKFNLIRFQRPNPRNRATLIKQFKIDCLRGKVLPPNFDDLYKEPLYFDPDKIIR